MSFNSPKYQIFILSYNRPGQLREAVESWLTQDLSGTQLIVSDNSSNENVAEMMASHFPPERFPQIELRKRRPSTNSNDHFNKARSEASAPWFMLFHDDDLMAPGGFAAYKKAAQENPQVAAIAGNSYFMRNDKITTEKFNSDLESPLVFATVADFASRYFHPVSTLQPLPGYLYNTERIKELSFDFRKARKYSDFIFLTEVCEKGPILWLPDMVMYTRVHAGNDSGSHDIKAVVLARRRLIARGVFKANDSRLELYRHWNYLLHLRAIGVMKKPWLAQGSKRTITWATWKYFLLHPMPLLQKIATRVRHQRF